VVDDFREQAQHRGSELHYRIEAPVRALCDRARMEQVAVNLISNAMKYGGGKPIEVRVEATGDGGALVSVSDQGIGIALEDLDRIFSRFERAAPVRHFGGLGLGLYVTRNIVEAHGGRIRVQSQLGEGSTFVIELPPPPRAAAHAGGAKVGP
jgi:signal transduction histidine kinase